MSESDSEDDFESADDTEHEDSSERSSKSSNSNLSAATKVNTNLSEKLSTVNITQESSISHLENQQLNRTTSHENTPATSETKSDTPVKDEKPLPNIDVTSEKKNVDAQARKRVTLRLEKKLQQKCQPPVKEHAVESETAEKPKEVPKSHDQEKSSWGFGSWGTSLLSTAAASVTTFTTQVSQGIGTVLETVETTLGAPPPEELATVLNDKTSDSMSDLNESTQEKSELNEQKENATPDQETERKNSGTSLLSEVTSWTKVLESTGSKVIMGGLDTLELIGKKTIDILTEGDPGLRRKRAVFTQGSTLSQLLREAKTKADEQQEEHSYEGENAIHYSQYFDECQGLAHLEALEILSEQCRTEVEDLMKRNSEKSGELEDVKAIFDSVEISDNVSGDDKDQNFESDYLTHIHSLNLSLDVEKIRQTQKNIRNYTDTCLADLTAEEIYRESISTLADFTAKCIEQFHKIAELLLVQSKVEPSAVQFATHLAGLTTLLCTEISIASCRYGGCLDAAAKNNEESGKVTPLITNVYLEASNSNEYIRGANELLLPVLQLSVLESIEN